MKGLTQKEMARRLGVSQTAVSLVLNDPETPKVSSNSRQRILNFARKHYRSLPQRQTGTIGFVMSSDRHATRARAFRTQRYLTAVQSRARSLGLNLLVETDGERADFGSWRNRVEGMIVRTTLDERTLEGIREMGPVVLLNCHVPTYEFDMVMPDNWYGTQNLVGRLVALGHRRIAFFARRTTARPDTEHQYFERFEGYRRGLVRYGLPQDEALMAYPLTAGPWFDHVRKQTREALERWMALDDPPTAVIGAIDEHALGFLEAAEAMGLHVPEDLSVVGFDNVFGDQLTGPALASVEQNAEDMGALAVELVHDRIKRPHAGGAHKVLCQTELIERASLGPAPAGH